MRTDELKRLLRMRGTRRWSTHIVTLGCEKQPIGVMNAYKSVLRDRFLFSGMSINTDMRPNLLLLVAGQDMTETRRSHHPDWIVQVIGYHTRTYEHRAERRFDLYSTCLFTMSPITGSQPPVRSIHDILGISFRDIPFRLRVPSKLRGTV